MTQLPTNKEELRGLIEEIVARRLVEKAAQTTTLSSSPAKTEVTAEPNSSPASESVEPSVEFAKVEKNLASLGFFTPSSKRIKEAKVKTVSINTMVNGNRVEARATIAPAALYGLPITADQDKYLALQKLITDLRQRQGGQVSNPISFTSAEILVLLHKYRDSGKNYREIDEWLNVMSSTTIISEGAVYLAGKKRFVKDRFHVFDRAVSFGKELEPGVLADKNYVWLSDWQLQNINNNHLIRVDLEVYRQLRNHIAKTLVPLLQIWLYASRKEGSFEKRYDELCQILSIREYFQISRIKEQLGPSLDELAQHGYLASWGAEKTTDEKGYKIAFRHGEKFHRDRQRRLAHQTSLTAPAQPPEIQQPARRARVKPQPEVDPVLLAELTKRGVGESGARRLLAKLPPDRPVRDLLEWGDAETARQPGKITNPAGFYIRLLEEHSAPPPTFESSPQKAAGQEANLAPQRPLVEAQVRQQAEEDHQRRRGEGRFAVLTKEQRQGRLDRCKGELFSENPFMARQPDGSRILERAVHARVIRQLAQEPMELIAVPRPSLTAESSAEITAEAVD